MTFSFHFKILEKSKLNPKQAKERKLYMWGRKLLKQKTGKSIEKMNKNKAGF